MPGQGSDRPRSSPAHRGSCGPATTGFRGRRLGRHVERDARSRNSPAASAPISDVKHLRHGKPFDQGDLGSCTGNAMAGAMMTAPYYHASRTMVEANAVLLYEQATHLDRVPGSYPPDDTGSTGLAVAKAAKRDGYISAYSLSLIHIS